MAQESSPDVKERTTIRSSSETQCLISIASTFLKSCQPSPTGEGPQLDICC